MDYSKLSDVELAEKLQKWAGLNKYIERAVKLEMRSRNMPELVSVEGDLNGDGKFDAKDKTIAAKVLAKGRRTKRTKKKK